MLFHANIWDTKGVTILNIYGHIDKLQETGQINPEATRVHWSMHNWKAGNDTAFNVKTFYTWQFFKLVHNVTIYLFKLSQVKNHFIETCLVSTILSITKSFKIYAMQS